MILAIQKWYQNPQLKYVSFTINTIYWKFLVNKNPRSIPTTFPINTMGLQVSWLELLPACQGRGRKAHNSYTIGTHGLPDMYTLGPWASGVHIRQTTRAHGITCIMYSYLLTKIQKTACQYIRNSYNTATRDLPDIGIYIRQITSGHIISNICHVTLREWLIQRAELL